MEKIIYSQGSFDLVHSGHINILKKCRKLAGKDGKVIIALVTDKAYLKYRGYKPAKIYSERKAILESFVYVDEVIPVDPPKTKQQIKKIKPDWVVIGSDWASKNLYKQYNMKPEELDPILLYVPYTTKISSTMIKERIKGVEKGKNYYICPECFAYTPPSLFKQKVKLHGFCSFSYPELYEKLRSK